MDSNFKTQMKELEQLKNEVDSRQRSLRSNAIAEAQSIIDQFQLSSSDFRFYDPEAMRRTRRGPVAPKYRGPNGELWTGRGRTPKWAERAMANGEDLKKYLIHR